MVSNLKTVSTSASGFSTYSILQHNFLGSQVSYVSSVESLVHFNTHSMQCFLYGFGIMLCSYKFAQIQRTNIGYTVPKRGMLWLMIGTRAGCKNWNLFNSLLVWLPHCLKRLMKNIKFSGTFCMSSNRSCKELWL